VNLFTIRTNLAAKFAPGTISTPSGASAMRFAFADTPKSIPATPAVYVEGVDGEIVFGSGEWTVTNHLIVNFLLAKKPGDPERVDAQRDRWLTTLLQAAFSDIDLGATVKSALPVRWEYAEIDMGADLYDGIRIFVDAIVREPVTLSA